MSLTFTDDVKEQFFQRRRRILDAEHLGPVVADDLEFLRSLGRSERPLSTRLRQPRQRNAPRESARRPGEQG